MYSDNNQNMHSDQVDKSYRKLALLGVASIVVFFLTITIPYLVCFSAFPLVVAMATYTRKKSYFLVAACCAAVLGVLSSFHDFYAMALFPVYLVSVFMAIVVGEILARQIEPKKAILSVGSFLVLVVFLGGGALLYSKKDQVSETIKTSLVQLQEQAGEENQDFKDQVGEFINLVDDVVNLIPAYAFISIFLGIWLNLYLMLRGHVTLKFMSGYPYKLKDLTKLRLPNWVVYSMLGVLALHLAPQEYVVADMKVWSRGLLYVYAAFYFLQGFGIYLDYLSFINAKGFFRSFLIAITVVFGYFFVIGLGVFDMWFDFRKFFKKQNKGE